MDKNQLKFRGLELGVDEVRIKTHLLPPGESLTNFSANPQPYFKRYGFKVPESLSLMYERCGAPKSDKYIPASIYFYYISPYLFNMNMNMAYVDKNAYTRLFPDIKQPRTIISNINRKFYEGALTSSHTNFISEEDAINILLTEKEYIIKPAIESGSGRDVVLIKGEKSKAEIKKLINFYDSDYIIQEVVKQYEKLSLLNPSSLNTCRVYTFLPPNSTKFIILGSAVRFGGNGEIRDNASSGGGFCNINPDGSIDDRISQFCFWGKRSLAEEKGLKGYSFPFYEEVKKLCIKLHLSMPYMNLVGWDIAINQEGEPVLIELNCTPDCEFIQIANGPMFGDYTDELLEEVSKAETKFMTVAKRSFPNLSWHNAYNFELGKKYSL